MKPYPTRSCVPSRTPLIVKLGNVNEDVATPPPSRQVAVSGALACCAVPMTLCVAGAGGVHWITGAAVSSALVAYRTTTCVPSSQAYAPRTDVNANWNRLCAPVTAVHGLLPSCAATQRGAAQADQSSTTLALTNGASSTVTKNCATTGSRGGTSSAVGAGTTRTPMVYSPGRRVREVATRRVVLDPVIVGSAGTTVMPVGTPST